MPEKNHENAIQEIQMIEQSLQNLLFQRQAFQMELSETQSALREIEKSGEEIFKIIGQLMVKADKGKVEEELKNKEKLLDLRMKSLEKQETSLAEKAEELKKKVLK